MGLVRKHARQRLEEVLPEEPTPDALLGLLGDPDVECRREAALGLVGVTEAVPELLVRAGVEKDPRVLESILITLAAHDTAEVAGSIAVHLASDDAWRRTAAAAALATMPRSVPALMPALIAAPDHDVRVMTAMVLAALPHPEVRTWLVRMISEDPHPNVVTAAIDVLLPAATLEDVALLEAAVRRFPDDPFLRFTVQSALPRLAGTPA
ncbi:HEAT repeat domain-containing protein [Actinoplanes sp. CA-252034]|uniref:HEAT repeat domain-containing protein n=1 Tax=Actinoplanes sp. CA-252034 TaxID=3239906 RepID=UPI003D954254